MPFTVWVRRLDERTIREVLPGLPGTPCWIGLCVRGTGEAWNAFQRKRCVSQALKAEVSRQRLGLGPAGIMEPNVQSREMEKNQSREAGMLDSTQGQMMLGCGTRSFEGADFLPRAREAITGS